MNEKRKHGVSKKFQREAKLMGTSSAQTNNISDDINPKALQWFYNQWKNKKQCIYMRVSYDTWYVMRMH